MLFGQSDKPTELSYAQTSKTFPEIVDFKSSRTLLKNSGRFLQKPDIEDCKCGQD